MSTKNIIKINGLAKYESSVTGETGRQAKRGALVEFLGRAIAGFAARSARE
ncbi:hypothetical protein [Aquabacterium sp.]|uniref:hypothetical protein n=1 Tax=Aquabacterium sp. TaxID=1872578 RepID=UPI0035B0D2A0